MEAGLKEFIEIYAKDNKLSEIEVAMYAGAMGHDAIEDLDQYKKFVLTLGIVAPQLIGYVSKKG